MAHLILVRNLGEFTMKIDVFQSIMKIGFGLIKMKDFPGKIEILLSICRYFNKDKRNDNI